MSEIDLANRPRPSLDGMFGSSKAIGSWLFAHLVVSRCARSRCGSVTVEGDGPTRPLLKRVGEVLVLA